jgi:hypothetical protein
LELISQRSVPSIARSIVRVVHVVERQPDHEDLKRAVEEQEAINAICGVKWVPKYLGEDTMQFPPCRDCFKKMQEILSELAEQYNNLVERYQKLYEFVDSLDSDDPHHSVSQKGDEIL